MLNISRDIHSAGCVGKVIPILCEVAHNTHSMECWGYTNKAHLRGLN
jgi:hypothetical protein